MRSAWPSRKCVNTAGPRGQGGHFVLDPSSSIKGDAPRRTIAKGGQGGDVIGEVIAPHDIILRRILALVEHVAAALRNRARAG
jgi:hypothetical protein